MHRFSLAEQGKGKWARERFSKAADGDIATGFTRGGDRPSGAESRARSTPNRPELEKGGEEKEALQPYLLPTLRQTEVKIKAEKAGNENNREIRKSDLKRTSRQGGLLERPFTTRGEREEGRAMDAKYAGRRENRQRVDSKKVRSSGRKSTG